MTAPTRCPAWCTDDSGHDWSPAEDDEEARTHQHPIGQDVCISAMETRTPAGVRWLDSPVVMIDHQEMDSPEAIDQLAADLIEAAALLRKIQADRALDEDSQEAFRLLRGIEVVR